MSCLHWLLLSVVKKLHGERKIGGIYHLLTGKHSAQTIQDAYLFHLSPYIATLSNCDKKQYEQWIENLRKQQMIQLDKEIPYLTENGETYLRKLSKTYHLPEYFHGGKYEWNGAATKLWNRLSLTVQTLSYILSQNRSFIPICYELETQQWVKTFLQKNQFAYEKISEHLHEELVAFLQLFQTRERELFVNRLTGFNHIGKTFHQLCINYENDSFFAKLYFQSILHKMIAHIKENGEQFNYLHSFLEHISEARVITRTADKTWHFVQRGKTLEEIAKIRGLKRSTIEDHFIELAIYEPQFSIEPYISNEEIKEILTVAKKLNTKRLRQIKELVDPNITYFQIRLALTQFHRGNEKR